MEKSNKSNANTKKEKVDASGLSKKERRALKVQQKPDQSNEAAKPAPVQQPAKSESSHTEKETSKMSEKELRRLEWERKLAEQKKEDKAGDEGLSKAQMKQKRREQQEAQRLAKQQQEQKKEVKPEEKIVKQIDPLAKPTVPKPTLSKKIDRQSPEKGKLQIVKHLYTENLKSHSMKAVYKNILPAFVKLGVQYSSKQILGSNARCLGLLSALENLVKELEVPRDQEFCRYLESVLNNSVAFLQQSRPFAVSMSNALRYFKIKLQDAKEMNDIIEQRKYLLLAIKTYIDEEINKAGEAISMRVKEKITNDDVILTFGCSSLIKKILLDAQKDGKKFQVVIVDGRPLLEGRQMLQRLVQAGIQCNYVLINSLSFVMSHVTKVLLGAHALLTNGYVMSRIGTAQVALVARAFNKPVLVCCETYKFSERVQTDSFVYNELADANVLKTIDTMEEPSPLQSNKNENLKILNLLYDVTPSDLVTAVVTEIAILPCSSAPVVLRIKPTDFGDK